MEWNNEPNYNAIVNTDEKHLHKETSPADENVVPASDMSYRIKFFKTCCMLLIYIGLGVWCGVVGPTMVDITDLYNCTYDEFVRATTMKPVGVMAGSFIGAAVADRLRANADLPMFIAILSGGLSCLAVPWAPNLWVMGVFWFINGLAHGTLNVLCNSLCIAIWGTSASTAIHALHMTFTIGVTISPPLVLPFLARDTNNTCTANHTINHRVSNLLLLTDRTAGYFEPPMAIEQFAIPGSEHLFDFYHEHDNMSLPCQSSSSVRIPYMIFGGWGVLVSVIFLIFFICGSTYTSTTVKKRESIKEMFNFGAVARGNVKFGLYFVITLFFLYIFIQGRDGSAATFLFVIANKGRLNMSKAMSALLVTIFGLCTAIGRGISGVLSRWIPIQLLLFSQLLLACIVQILLIFFSLDSLVSFWILMCLSGLFMGPTYPSVMSWTDQYIEATGVVIAIIDIGIGIGAFVSLWISGALFHGDINQGAQAVFILGAIFGICVVILLTPLQVVAYFKGNRHKLGLTGIEKEVNQNQTVNDNEGDDEHLII